MVLSPRATQRACALNKRLNDKSKKVIYVHSLLVTKIHRRDGAGLENRCYVCKTNDLFGKNDLFQVNQIIMAYLQV